LFVERKLAAILAADVVGYSRLMAENEADTFDRLRAHRKELFEPEIAKHHGRIFKLMGDGLLAEFGSVVDAVECAAELQREMARRNEGIPEDRCIQLRIGLHVGDVIVEGEDRHGDAVNVAARLEQLAEPGGICVSDTVLKHVKQKVALVFELKGEEQLKNIAEPVRVFRVRSDGVSEAQRPALALPDKPSIAVLPFQNLSGDPEQEYFADGIVEEITTALSRFRQLFVIARNSSFTYKGRAVDVKQVGRELGVRYVLEGSVRKAGNRVRITGQLIDTATGAHLWADRFEGALEDIFDLQDQVTASVVGAIAPRLEQAEIERAQRKPTDSLDAYDYFLRGMAAFHQWTREGSTEALSNFYRAIEIDPKFASAYGMAARCYPQRKASGWVVSTQEAAEAKRLARRAAELGGNDALALSTAGFVLAYVAGEPENGAALIDRALALNPNMAWAWLFSGWARAWLGEPEVAIDHEARAMRLSPHDPQLFQMQAATAYAHFFADRYSDAVLWAEMALVERPSHVSATRALAASCAMAGRQEQASQAMARLRDLDPALRLSNLKDVIPLRRAEDFNRLAEALRRAGLPE
jgi:TolB-like protein/Tfp pilus assembly protein PilF